MPVLGCVLCGGVAVAVLVMTLLSAGEEATAAWLTLALVSGTLLLAGMAWSMAFRRRS
jgi:hypothetical protein